MQQAERLVTHMELLREKLSKKEIVYAADCLSLLVVFYYFLGIGYMYSGRALAHSSTSVLEFAYNLLLLDSETLVIFLELTS